MIASLPLCIAPIIILGLIAILLNTIMVVAAFQRKSFNRSINIVFAYIGLSNLLMSIALIVRGATVNIHYQPNLLEPFVVSIVCSFSIMQLTANLEMAWNRFIAVVHPLEFRTTNRSKTVRRIITGCLFSFVFGFTTSFPSALFGYPRLTSLVIAAARTLVLIFLSILYYKIIKKSRLNSQTVAANRERVRQNVPSIHERRIQADRKLLRICLAIPTTYFVLNLPAIIYMSIYEVGAPCETVKGKLIVFLMSLTFGNLIIDPILYFCTTKKTRIDSLRS